MGRLIDETDLMNLLYALDDARHELCYAIKKIPELPTVEAIPKDEVRQFILNIQKIKDNHNEHGSPINYGTICGILIEGYRLLDKYREGKDGNND